MLRAALLTLGLSISRSAKHGLLCQAVVTCNNGLNHLQSATNTSWLFMYGLQAPQLLATNSGKNARQTEDAEHLMRRAVRISCCQRGGTRRAAGGLAAMRTMACKVSDSSPKHLCDVSVMRCLPGQIVAAGRRRHWYMVDIAAGAVTRFPRLRNVPDRSLESFAVCRDAKARIPTPASVGGTSATAVGCSKSKASACLRYALSGGLEPRIFSVPQCSYACLAFKGVAADTVQRGTNFRTAGLGCSTYITAEV